MRRRAIKITYVALPPEDEDGDEQCGLLKRHMYGTRPAADGWQEECSTTLVELGFRQGEACPNLFRHAEKGILCSVHGDDFTILGYESDLDWFRVQILTRFEVKFRGRIGNGERMIKPLGS